MLTPTAVRLTLDVIRDLHTQGLTEQAAAVEEVLTYTLSEAASTTERSTGAQSGNYMTTGAAAQALGVSTQTIKNWVTAGKLPAMRLGSRTMVLRAAITDTLRTLRDEPHASPRQLAGRLEMTTPDEMVALDANLRNGTSTPHAA